MSESDFTREDVELARGLADYLVNGSYKRLDAIGIRRWNHEPASALNTLAAKIEARLTPEHARDHHPPKPPG